MNFIDIILIALALAMDCFAISIVSAVIMQQPRWDKFIQMSLLFGIFQSIMPLIGWISTNKLYDYINTFGHWLAFAILFLLGLKMIKDSLSVDDGTTGHFNPLKFKTQIMLAIATSIDALAVGITFTCVGYQDLFELYFPLTIIGLVSLLCGIVGCYLGLRFGKVIRKHLYPEMIGGVILIIIGLKVLVS